VLIAGYGGCAVAAESIHHGVSSLIRLMGCPSGTAEFLVNNAFGASY